MKAYEQGITKEQFVNEMRLHKEMDNFISGTYGDLPDEYKERG